MLLKNEHKNRPEGNKQAPNRSPGRQIMQHISIPNEPLATNPAGTVQLSERVLPDSAPGKQGHQLGTVQTLRGIRLGTGPRIQQVGLDRDR